VIFCIEDALLSDNSRVVSLCRKLVALEAVAAVATLRKDVLVVAATLHDQELATVQGFKVVGVGALSVACGYRDVIVITCLGGDLVSTADDVADKWMALLEMVYKLCKRLIIVCKASPANNSLCGSLVCSQWEHAKVPARFVSVHEAVTDAATLGRIIDAEVCDTSLEMEVRYNFEGSRHAVRYQRILEQPGAFQRQGVAVITGGTGGLGLKSARVLAELGYKHIVLLSRTCTVASSDEGSRTELQWLQTSSGAAVQLLKCDVSDENSVVLSLDRIRGTVGPVGGIIHAAGVIRDGLLRGGSARAGSGAVWTAKALSALLLHKHTQEDNLDFFVTFSSITSAIGNVGQSAYGMANRMLDELMEQRSADGLPGLSIQWPAISDVGMAVSVIKNGGALTTEDWSVESVEFMEILKRGLRCSLGAPRVWCMMPTAILRSMVGQSALQFEAVMPALAPTTTASRPSGPAGMKTSTKLSREEALMIVASVVGELLNSGEVPADQQLMDLGLDSLGATELASKLSMELGIEVVPTFLFSYPTLEDINNYVVEQLQLSVAAATSTPPLSTVVRSADENSVAIIGVGCRLPGDVNSLDDLWRLVSTKQDAISAVSTDRWNSDAVAALIDSPVPDFTDRLRYGGFLSNEVIDSFDASYFNISDAEANRMDPAQRLLLTVCSEALADAGYSKDAVRGMNVGVFVAASGSIGETNVIDLLNQPEPSELLNAMSVYDATGKTLSVASGRISYCFGLTGPCSTVDTACSSSLVALHNARTALQNGECLLAVVAGVGILNLTSQVSCAVAGMTSADGKCRTFDESAAGYGRGEGCAAIVLKRCSDNTAPVYALVRGSAFAQDGKSASLTAPNGLAQEKLLRTALTDADLEPSDVSFVEAHGTGTKLGDPVETVALANVFGAGRKSSRPLYVSSVKANIGHLEAAAGMAGILATMLALHHRCAVPNAQLRKLNGQLLSAVSRGLEFPVSLTAMTSSSALIGGVSSFGYSGTIAHVLMSEAPQSSRRRTLQSSRSAVAVQRSAPSKDHPLVQQMRRDAFSSTTVVTCAMHAQLTNVWQHSGTNQSLSWALIAEFAGASALAFARKSGTTASVSEFRLLCDEPAHTVTQETWRMEQLECTISSDRKLNVYHTGTDGTRLHIAAGDLVLEAQFPAAMTPTDSAITVPVDKASSCAGILSPATMNALHNVLGQGAWELSSCEQLTLQSRWSAVAAVHVKRTPLLDSVSLDCLFVDRNNAVVGALLGAKFVQPTKRGSKMPLIMQDRWVDLPLPVEAVNAKLSALAVVLCGAADIEQFSAQLPACHIVNFEQCNGAALGPEPVAACVLLVGPETVPSSETVQDWLKVLETCCSRYGKVVVACAECPWTAECLGGVLATARLEYPQVSIAFVSCGSTSDLEHALTAELSLAGQHAAVKYVNGSRFVLNYALLVPQPHLSVMADRSGYVIITGGLGGLGLRAAKELVTLGYKKVVLVSRSGRVAYEGQGLEEQLLWLQTESTAEVLVMKCDVSKEDALLQLLRAVRDMGTIGGIVHAAGRLRDGLIRGGSALVGADEVWLAKAHSAYLLHKHTLSDNVALFVMFSSIAATTGNPGQSAYGAANRYLDGLAVHRRAQNLTAISIQWPAINEIGMAAVALQATDFSAPDNSWSIGPDVYATIFREAMSGRYDGVSVVTILPEGVLPLCSELVQAQFQRPVALSMTCKRTDAPRVQWTREAIAQRVWETVRTLVDEHTALSEDAVLMDVGLDSLGVTELATRLSGAFGLRVMSSLIFSYPTVKDIITYFTEHFTAPEQAASSTSPTTTVVPTRSDIAVIGISCRFPADINSLIDLWEVTSGAKNVSGEVSLARWDTDLIAASMEPQERSQVQRIRYGSFLSDEVIETFDNAVFGISETEASRMDPAQRLLLTVSYEALVDAGYSKSELVGRNVGVFVAASGLMSAAKDNYCSVSDASGMSAYDATGMTLSVASGRISFCLGLRGPSQTIDTACSSSLVALHAARRSIQLGECDLAVVASVGLLSASSSVACAIAGMTSEDGKCRVFDESAKGYGRGEGAGAVVVIREDAAAQLQKPAYAVVKGSAVMQDGKSASLTAPNGLAQEDLLRATLRDAGLDTTDVKFIEAHGTGTKLGDPVESGALAKVYGSGRTSANPLYVSSIKGNIGHLEAAAGMAGLLSAILAVRNRQVAPNAQLVSLNKEVGLSSVDAHLVFPMKCENLVSPTGRLVGAVSSFGYSGTIAHVLIAEPSPAHARQAGASTAYQQPQQATGTAWQFSGQGTLTVNACRDVYDQQPIFRRALSECNAVLVDLLGTTVQGLLYGGGSAELLMDTDVAQPVLVALQYALAQVQLVESGTPDALCGHSLGEYAAAVIAGVMSLEDCLRLVCARARIMQAYTGGLGSMLAVRLTADVANNAITSLNLSDDVAVAAVNGPRSIVLSGRDSALAAVLQYTKCASSHKLTVKHAFHSPLMRGMLDEYRQVLDTVTLRAPTVRWVSTVGDTTAAVSTVQYWLDHVVRPVHYLQAVTTLVENKTTTLIEVGCDSTLTKLSTTIAASLCAKVACSHCTASWNGTVADIESVRRFPRTSLHYSRLLQSAARDDLDRSMKYTTVIHAGILSDWLDKNRAVTDASGIPAGLLLDMLCNAVCHAECSKRDSGLALLGITDIVWSKAAQRGTHLRLSCIVSDAGIFTLHGADAEGNAVEVASGCVEAEPAPIVPTSAIAVTVKYTNNEGYTLTPALVNAIECAVRKHVQPSFGFTDNCVLHATATPRLTASCLSSYATVFFSGSGTDSSEVIVVDESARPLLRMRLRLSVTDSAVLLRSTWVEAPVTAAAPSYPASVLHIASDEATLALSSDVIARAGSSSVANVLFHQAVVCLGAMFETGQRFEVALLCVPLCEPTAVPVLLAQLLNILEQLCKTARAVRLVPSSTTPATSEAELCWSAVSGVCLCAQSEYPNVDIELAAPTTYDGCNAAACAALLKHALGGATELEVRYGDNRRLARRYVPTVYAPLPSARSTAGAVIVTGGLGGLGLCTTRTLVGLGYLKIVLVSRSGTVSQSNQGLEEELQWLTNVSGAAVSIVRCDVSDESQVIRLLDSIRTTAGGIAGIVHTAGVLSDGLIRGGAAAAGCSAVWNAKALSAWLLHKHTVGDKLDIFLTFSSVSAAVGTAGQSVYASANGFLDGLAAVRRASGLAGVSIQWPAVTEIGMAAAKFGDGILSDLSINKTEFTQILSRVINSEVDAVVTVATSGMHRLLEPRVASQFADVFQRSDAIRSSKPAKVGVPAGPVYQRDHISRVVKKVVGSLVGTADLPGDAQLMDLGLDSLGATDLVYQLSRELQVELLPTLLFNYPSIDAVVQFLCETLGLNDAEESEENRQTPSHVATGDQEAAIVGISCRLPGGISSPQELWSTLLRGESKISEVSTARWDTDAVIAQMPNVDPKVLDRIRYGGFLLNDVIDTFDAAFFGISEVEAAHMDPAQRLLLTVSYEALVDAGYTKDSIKGKNVGVFVGASGSLGEHNSGDAYDANEVSVYHATGATLSVAAGRISYVLGLTGPSSAIDTACSSSLVALHSARRALQHRECDLAIVASVGLLTASSSVACAVAGMTSADGVCHSFDAGAIGYGRGEGCGAVVLKSTNALTGDDAVYAVVKASAVAQDGRSASLTAPNGLAQEKLLLSALSEAGVQPSDVCFVEAHGTGTKLGDPVETGALCSVFNTDRQNPLLVGSVKANIGHLEAAAGMAGLIAAVLALYHRQAPPNAQLRELNPKVAETVKNAAITFPTSTVPLNGQRLLAGVSSFGYSGTISHVLLEEPAEHCRRRPEFFSLYLPIDYSER
jgi:acyl transferase domain-containing protein/NAD(P)-dependent dehydrogenase (short-subunit alcohol dehydrogenase family)/acyl carrier protein